MRVGLQKLQDAPGPLCNTNCLAKWGWTVFSPNSESNHMLFHPKKIPNCVGLLEQQAFFNQLVLTPTPNAFTQAAGPPRVPGCVWTPAKREPPLASWAGLSSLWFRTQTDRPANQTFAQKKNTYTASKRRAVKPSLAVLRSHNASLGGAAAVQSHL